MLKFIKNIFVLFKKIFYIFDSHVKLSIKRKKERNDLIKLIFVCQFLPAWDKIKNLYFDVQNDSAFSCSILCVPSDVLSRENDTYSEILKQDYPKSTVINALNDSGSYIKLKSLDYDFIFYDRPYNSCLPKEYHARIAAKYGSICFHPYALCLSKRLHEALMFDSFYRYISYYFAESSDTLNLFNQKYSKHNKYQHGIYLGYLGIDNVYAQKEIKTDIWDFCRDSFKIIWTPRWSTDSVGGGSNFLEYNDSFFNLLNNEKLSLIIRPHPLMISNFVKSGLMSNDDVACFFSKIEQNKRICYDSSSHYIPTFWNSNVLVTDFSSVIAEYIVTNKPIIFCNSKIEWDFFPFAKELIDCCYIANSFLDIQSYLLDLEKGIDPYFNRRKAFVEKHYSQANCDTANRMHKYLYCSFENNK